MFMVSPHHVEQSFMIGLNASRREESNLKMIQERGVPLPQKIKKTSGLSRIQLKKIEELLSMKSPIQCEFHMDLHFQFLLKIFA